jgi:Lon-like protease
MRTLELSRSTELTVSAGLSEPLWRTELRRRLNALRWTDYFRRLAALPVFAACSRPEIRTIAHWGDEVLVEPGRPLLREGTIGHHFVVVESGELTVTRKGRSTATLHAGDYIGDVAILGFGPQPATVTASETSRLFVLSRVGLLSLAIHSPGFRQGLLGVPTQDDALQRVRQMRVEGLASWPRRARSSVAAATALPASFHQYQPRPSRGPIDWLPSLPESAVAPAPRSKLTPQVRAKVGAAIAVVAVMALAFVSLTVRPPIAVVTPSQPIDVAADMTVVGAATQPIHGRYILTSVHVERPNLASWALARARHKTTAPLAPRTVDASRNARQAFVDGQDAAVDAAAALAGIDRARLRVEFAPHDLTGPSGSLVYAIAIADLLDPADLAAGRTIAATGGLDRGGHVRDVGFVRHKATAARGAGATILFVPKGQNPGQFAGLKIIEVATLAEALAALRAA